MGQTVYVQEDRNQVDMVVFDINKLNCDADPLPVPFEWPDRLLLLLLASWHYIYYAPIELWSCLSSCRIHPSILPSSLRLVHLFHHGVVASPDW